MTKLDFFLKGLILAFSLGAAVGPICMLCIQRTLQYGRFSGLFSGLGAAFADTFYGIVAAFGLTFISNFLIASQFWLRLLGGGFLLYLGIKIFFAQPKLITAHVSHKSLIKDFFSTFFLTLTNPMTIIFYIAIFAGLGLGETKGNYSLGSWLVLGVFLGSSLWFLLLSEGLTLFRHRITQKAMIWINRLAGIFIMGFGAFLLITLAIRWAK